MSNSKVPAFDQNCKFWVKRPDGVILEKRVTDIEKEDKIKGEDGTFMEIEGILKLYTNGRNKLVLIPYGSLDNGLPNSSIIISENLTLHNYNNETNKVNKYLSAVEYMKENEKLIEYSGIKILYQIIMPPRYTNYRQYVFSNNIIIEVLSNKLYEEVKNEQGVEVA